MTSLASGSSNPSLSLKSQHGTQGNASAHTRHHRRRMRLRPEIDHPLHVLLRLRVEALWQMLLLGHQIARPSLPPPATSCTTSPPLKSPALPTEARALIQKHGDQRHTRLESDADIPVCTNGPQHRSAMKPVTEVSPGDAHADKNVCITLRSTATGGATEELEDAEAWLG